MVKDTSYNLSIQLQRIDDKIALLPQNPTKNHNKNINLNVLRSIPKTGSQTSRRQTSHAKF
ncbi:hypothetical protein LY78DRAFT_687597 [Colletotrichum sublineola]|nr:hypothetical protein LY78DRAFT_687597 [Colletotrichum sublineola]